MLQFVSYGIPPTWVNPFGNRWHYFKIKFNQTYHEDMPIIFSQGDGLAVFGTVAGVEKCLGYTSIDNSKDSISIYTTAETFALVSNVRIEFWDVNKGCVRSMIDTISDSRILKDSGSSHVGVLRSYDLKVTYASMQTNEVAVAPLYNTQGVPAGTLLFTGNKTLSINQGNGVINPKLSGAGTFIVKISSAYCLAYDSLPVVVTLFQDTAIIDTNSIRFEVLPPTCDQNGSIVLVSDPLGPEVSFVLYDVLTGERKTGSNGDVLKNIKDGTYKVELLYKRQYFYTYPQEFTLSRLKGCTNLVLSFSGGNSLRTVFIDKAGTGEIFNREGKRVRVLQLPTEWDGTDQSSNELPMGDYYLYINSQKQMIISILR